MCCVSSVYGPAARLGIFYPLIDKCLISNKIQKILGANGAEDY